MLFNKNTLFISLQNYTVLWHWLCFQCLLGLLRELKLLPESSQFVLLTSQGAVGQAEKGQIDLYHYFNG